MRTPIKFLALSSCLALFLAACGEENVVKIGYIGPLTGDAAPYGVDTLNGTKLKIEELNAAGGINGMQIQLIAEDARCTGIDAASAAHKLINVDRVAAIIGGQCSGETLGAAPIAEAAGMVMISPVSSSPDVTNAGSFIFRDYPSDALKTKAMANYFAEAGIEKVAIIAENTDFAIAFRDSLVQNLAPDAVVFNEVVEPNTKDFRSLMTRLKDIEFDIFVADGQTSATIAAMLQQMQEIGIEAQAISHDVGEDKSLLDLAPIASEGMLTVNVPKIGDDEPFGQMFIPKYGEAQAALAFVGHAYDAMGVLAEALAAAGPNGGAVRDYLYGMEGYDGVVGHFRFDENGDVVGINYALSQVQNGQFVKIKDISVQ